MRGQQVEIGWLYFLETQCHSPELVGAPFIHNLVITALPNLPSGLQKAVLFVSGAFGADQTLQKVSRLNGPVSDRSGYLDNQTQWGMPQGEKRMSKSLAVVELRFET